MPQPTKIPRAFADSGDKNSIPDSAGNPGFASWQEGFPQITSEPFANGGIAPKRADFNGVFNALSAATVWNQQGGVYAYDATTDYEVGNVVEYNNDLYKCITANGPGSAVKDPTDTTVWSKVMTAADAVAAYLPLSGGAMSGDISNSAGTGFLRFLGGSNVNNGARLAVSPESDTTNPGQFWLVAKATGVGERHLIGKPDGTLTWDGKEVAAIRAVSLANRYICFTNGVQICWGWNTSPSVGSNNTNLPRAYADNTYAVFVTRTSGSTTTTPTDNAWVRARTTTTFDLYVPVYTGYYWLAIGQGAS